MKDFEKICPQCMKNSNDSEICQFCGEKINSRQGMPFLPKKILLSDRYLVGNGLEINGESLGYIMYDTVSNRKVYVKEFFPDGLCERSGDLLTVDSISHHKDNFISEKKNFFRYFKSLANLRNISNFVSVYDIFDENNTYYIVCEWVDGISLDKFVTRNGGKFAWSDIQKMFQPLFNGISCLHSAKLLHLGINPENIFVTSEKKLKLTGFATQSMRSKKSFLDPKLYKGTSALEQYLEIYDCDESTDVYGLCATIFFCLTGEYPPSAPSRKENESILMEESILREIPENVIKALVNGLKVYPNNRTFSITNLKADIFGSVKSKIAMIENSLSFDVEKNGHYGEIRVEKEKKQNFNIAMITCITVLSVFVVCLAVYWFFVKSNKKIDDKSDFSQTSSVVESENDSLLQSGSMSDVLENPLEKTKISAPKLVNLNYKDIKNSLKDDSDYKILLLSEEFSDTVSEGKIMTQSPSENEEMSVGDTITVTVSKGKKIKILPDISRNSISDASKKLTKLHLNPVSESDWSDDVEEGLVIGYKDNAIGDEVEYGSNVVFLISRGKK